MPSSATLTVRPDHNPGPLAIPRRIEVTDSRFALASKGFGIHTTALPAGLYRIRVESTENPFEQLVTLHPGATETVIYPGGDSERISSAAPIPGSRSMHEYFRGPLSELADPNRRAAKPARLVVMANRREESGSYPAIDFAKCRLLNASSAPIGFQPHLVRGEKNLWAGFAIDLEPGGYMLDWPSPDSSSQLRLRQSVWVQRRYCTLIFLPVGPGASQPTLDDVSIHYGRLDKPFVPEFDRGKKDAHDRAEDSALDEAQRATELALHSLAGGRLLLSRSEIDHQLLEAKFKYPMLGLLGAHLLLNRSSTERRVIEMVLRNLDILLPGHPDVAALRVRAGKRPRRVKWPPMFRLGYVALRDADWEKPGTFPSGSVADNVRARILSAGVWTTWASDPDVDRKAMSKADVRPRASKARTIRVTKASKGGGVRKARALAYVEAKPSRGKRRFAKMNKAKTRPTKNLRLTDVITPVDQVIAQQIRRYAQQARFTGRRALRPSDLRWTGLNMKQAKLALRFLKKKGLLGALKKKPLLEPSSMSSSRLHSAFRGRG